MDNQDFKVWQASRQYVTVQDIADSISTDAVDIHETATHGWLYDDGMWIVDLGNGKAWSLVEREDYSGSLESIERWVFNSTRTL